MKKIAVFLVCMFVFLFCGCKNQSQTVDVLDVAQASSAEADVRPEDAQLRSEKGTTGKIVAMHTAAYVFEINGELQLYGAVEYRNDADEPLYLSEAVFDFSGTQSLSQTFTPVLAQYNVLAPGESAYAAAWFSGEGFTANEALTLEATLVSVPGEEAAVPLTVNDVFFADNYPAFTTMTGTLLNSNAQSCSLNMIYAGLYDENDAFLGAWYFSQNAQLDSGDSVRFTTHLKAFPYNDLALQGVHCKCRALGFN